MITDLAERVDRVAATTGFAGVVRVERHGEIELDRAYGLADRAHRTPMRTDHQLGIASGAKGFTALTIMALVERGALSVTDPTRRWLGDDLPLIADDVIVAHLLAHTSGIGDYLDEDDELPDYPMPVPVHRLVRTEDYLPILDGHPTKFPAGQRFSYSNGGFVVLALVAERAGGQDFADLVDELVCRPAGLVDTAFLRADELPARAAVGYVETDGHWRTNLFHLPIVGSGDGGIFTTSADVHRLWAALDAGSVVSAATRDQMWSPRTATGPEAGARWYGWGFWRGKQPDEVELHGCDAGVSFRSVHDPVAGTTHTVIGTTADGAWPISDALDQALTD